MFKTNYYRQAITCAAVLYFCCSTNTTFAVYSWKQKATLPAMGRHDAAAFSIGTKGYFATGFNPAATYQDLWEWDLGTNVWTQKADLTAIERYGAFAFAINGKGYLGTGWTYTGVQLKDFYEYDPVSNSWTQKADFGGVPRYDAVGLSNGVKGYVGFGFNPNHNDWWEYDPTVNTWTAKTNFPGTARQSLTGFTIGTDVYVGTGATSGNTLFNDLWKYTPASNSWTQMSNFPGVARYATIGFVINGEGYIGSGGNGAGVYYQDFYKYDPGTNSWSPIASWPATARYAGDGFNIGVNGYAGLGTGVSNIYYNDFWEYSPDNVPVSNFTAPQNFCPGTCTDFTNLSTNATSYQWYFPGGNPSVSTDASPIGICYALPGNYDVTLISINANGSDSLTIQNYITIFPYPSPQGIMQNGDTLFANAGSLSYQWYYNGNIINGATNYYYLAPASGNYNVVTADTNGCEVEAVIYDVVAGTGELNNISNLNTVVTPNPFHTLTTIHVTAKEFGSNVSLEIFNISGECVAVLFHGRLNPGESRDIDFNGSEMSEGVYFYHITSDKESVNGRLILIK